MPRSLVNSTTPCRMSAPIASGDPSGAEDLAAVDVDHLRGDVAGLIRQQEQAGADHVRRLTEALQRGGLHEVVGELANDGPGCGGVGWPGRDRVDPDT